MYEPVTSDEVRRFGEEGIVERTAEYARYPRVFRVRPVEGGRPTAVIVGAAGKNLPRGVEGVLAGEGGDERPQADLWGLGFGRMAALNLAPRWNVVGTYRGSEAQARQLELMLRAHFGCDAAMEYLDVSRPETVAPFVERVYERYGGVQALIYSPSVGLRKEHFEQFTLDDMRFCMAGNHDSYFAMAQAVIPRALGQEAYARDVKLAVAYIGTISRDYPSPWRVAYCTSKAAGMTLTRNLSGQYAAEGVLAFNFDISIADTAASANSRGVFNTVMARESHAGRMLCPNELAHHLAYLIDEAPRHMMGEGIPAMGAFRYQTLYQGAGGPAAATAGWRAMVSALRTILTRNFVLLWVANFLHWSIYGFEIVLPKLIKAGGGQEDEIGIIMAAMWGVTIFARPVIGTLLARFRSKDFLMLGALLLVASLLLYAVPWPSVMFLLVPRAVQGLSLSCFWTSSANLAAEELPQALMGRGMAVYLLSGMSTGAYAPRLSEWVAGHFGFQSLFIVMAVVGGALIACLGLLREPAQASTPTARRQGRRELLARPFIWLLLLVSLCFGAGRIAYVNFLPTFGLERGLPTVGGYYLYYTISALIVRMLLVRYGDRWPYERLLVPALALHAFSIYVLTYVNSYPSLYLAGFVGGIGQGAYIPTINAYLVRNCPSSSRGLALGLFFSAREVGQCVSSVGYGFLIMGTGYGALWLWGAVLTALAAAVVGLMPGVSSLQRRGARAA